MGRARRRRKREPSGGSGEHELSSRDEPIAYVPVRSEAASEDVRTPVAPVLALEGLEPWAEIQAPALALEEPPADETSRADYDHPDQLLLEPAEATAPEALTAQAAAPEEVPVAPAPVVVPPPPEPDPAEVQYTAARAAAEEGRLADAKTLYRELLAKYPRHVRAHNNLALLLDQAGDHDAALAELDRALEFDAENSTLLTNRGALLGALGRYAAAERDLRRVLRVEPAHAEALFNLGVVMTKKGLWAEAVPHLRRAIELDPGRGPAYYYLGEALNHVDDLHAALGAYQRAAELQPNNPRALYGLGIIYDRLARPDDAAQMYRRAREVGRR